VPEVSVGLVVTHGRNSAAFTIAGGQSGTTIQKGGADSKATLEAPFDIVLQIVGMSLSLEDAMAAKRAQVSGSAALIRRAPWIKRSLEYAEGIKPKPKPKPKARRKK